MHTVKIAKFLTLFVGISGCFSVLFGAWLAHGGQALPLGLQDRLSIALQYQFIHTLALVLTIILYKVHRNIVLVLAAIFFALGIMLFSGSLYIKTFFDVTMIGKLAPFGGLSFALAWLLLGFAGSKMFQHKLGN
jgi:uncharacterized membrane protein YgdD (TMEM256/DUF423 family)